VRALGVSIPGTVDPQRKCSHNSPIMAGWHGVPLDRYFPSVTMAPVFVENDTNLLALSERGGHLATYTDALIVKASTGFGAGIVSGGVIHHGALGAAGEIGHVKYPPANGIPCRCGEVGCLEAVAGGWALVRNMRDNGHDFAHVCDVAALALAGESDACREVRRSGRQLGEVLAAAVRLLNPAAIVIGGDLVPAYDVFVAGLREILYWDASAIATTGTTDRPLRCTARSPAYADAPPLPSTTSSAPVQSTRSSTRSPRADNWDSPDRQQGLLRRSVAHR
jgi:predicted NBD/HSP70 family sugar kinase